MILFKNNSCIAEWMPNEKVLINHWHGRVNKDDYVSMMDACNLFIEANPVKLIVEDHMDLDYVWDGWEDVTVNYLLHSQEKNPDTHYAILDPHKGYTPFLKEDLTEKLKNMGVNRRVDIVTLASQTELDKEISKYRH